MTKMPEFKSYRCEKCGIEVGVLDVSGVYVPHCARHGAMVAVEVPPGTAVNARKRAKEAGKGEKAMQGRKRVGKGLNRKNKGVR